MYLAMSINLDSGWTVDRRERPILWPMERYKHDHKVDKTENNKSVTEK